jgi:hypothetical protein
MNVQAVGLFLPIASPYFTHPDRQTTEFRQTTVRATVVDPSHRLAVVSSSELPVRVLFWIYLVKVQGVGRKE